MRCPRGVFSLLLIFFRNLIFFCFLFVAIRNMRYHSLLFRFFLPILSFRYFSSTLKFLAFFSVTIRLLFFLRSLFVHFRFYSLYSLQRPEMGNYKIFVRSRSHFLDKNNDNNENGEKHKNFLYIMDE